MSNFESMLFSDSLKMSLNNLAMSKTFNRFDADDLVQQVNDASRMSWKPNTDKKTYKKE